MLTADEKENCMELIKSVYNGLELYHRSPDPKLAQSVFSLNESMIADVAKMCGLQSSIKDALKGKESEHKKRQEKIKQLEKQLMHKASIEEFKENVSYLFKQINSRWNEEGFKGAVQKKLNQDGNIRIHFPLDLLEEPWDLEEDDESEELDPKYKEAFQRKKLDVDQEEEYILIKDCDRNKEILTKVLQQAFPGVNILEWQHIKSNGTFYLREIRVSLSNLGFLEGNQ
jgi:hypothetical protein